MRPTRLGGGVQVRRLETCHGHASNVRTPDRESEHLVEPRERSEGLPRQTTVKVLRKAFLLFAIEKVELRVLRCDGERTMLLHSHELGIRRALPGDYVGLYVERGGRHGGQPRRNCYAQGD